MARENGTVKWFNGTKGYGFIQPDAGGKDIFVHMTAVVASGMSTLREGDRVSYETNSTSKKGPAAVDLQRA